MALTAVFSPKVGLPCLEVCISRRHETADRRFTGYSSTADRRFTGYSSAFIGHRLGRREPDAMHIVARVSTSGPAPMESGPEGAGVQDEDEDEEILQRVRLADLIQSVPDRAREYFRSPWRRAMYGGISLFGGFYVAQTISLSFGALGVNDVVASAICVLFTEYVTKFYHSRERITLPVALLNVFKMGFTYGLFIDAFKLAS